MVRREVCACGGVLIAPAAATEDILRRIVSDHNRLVRHQEWRMVREGRGEIRWVLTLSR